MRGSGSKVSRLTHSNFSLDESHHIMGWHNETEAWSKRVGSNAKLSGTNPAIRLLDRKVYTASVYLQVNTTEFGMWYWSMQSDTKRTAMRKDWQTDRINFELWEPIGLTTSSKKTPAVLNFPDYSGISFFCPIWYLHHYGELVKLDTLFLSLNRLAWSTTSGPVFMFHTIETCFSSRASIRMWRAYTYIHTGDCLDWDFNPG